MNTINAFVINKYQKLFLNTAAYEEFVKELEEACESTSTPLLVDGRVIGMTITPIAAKELLSRTLLQQLTKDPGQLKRLIASMEEEAVDMDDL